MTTYYWKVYDANGALLHRTGRYDTTVIKGPMLRKAYPKAHGFSVRRVTVRTVPKKTTATRSSVPVPVQTPSIFARIWAFVTA